VCKEVSAVTWRGVDYLLLSQWSCGILLLVSQMAAVRREGEGDREQTAAIIARFFEGKMKDLA
jgi:hypothetical protein